MISRYAQKRCVALCLRRVPPDSSCMPSALCLRHGASSSGPPHGVIFSDWSLRRARTNCLCALCTRDLVQRECKPWALCAVFAELDAATRGRHGTSNPTLADLLDVGHLRYVPVAQSQRKGSHAYPLWACTARKVLSLPGIGRQPSTSADRGFNVRMPEAGARFARTAMYATPNTRSPTPCRPPIPNAA